MDRVSLHTPTVLNITRPDDLYFVFCSSFYRGYGAACRLLCQARAQASTANLLLMCFSVLLLRQVLCGSLALRLFVEGRNSVREPSRGGTSGIPRWPASRIMNRQRSKLQNEANEAVPVFPPDGNHQHVDKGRAINKGCRQLYD